MKFKCVNHNNGKTESWNGEIVYLKNCSNWIQMNIQSRSSIDVIFGSSNYGNYVCVPNFEIGCYLSSFDDMFFNTEILSRLMGNVDGLTVATAIKYVTSEIYRT
ncbi:MAG: hypothetical protein PHC62_11205 [Candidatus Izemoplasmatales bacterium]|nr:hypothetical protein [Candidatus Izemoplasmatales bacterium]